MEVEDDSEEREDVVVAELVDSVMVTGVDVDSLVGSTITTGVVDSGAGVASGMMTKMGTDDSEGRTTGVLDEEGTSTGVLDDDPERTSTGVLDDESEGTSTGVLDEVGTSIGVLDGEGTSIGVLEGEGTIESAGVVLEATRELELGKIWPQVPGFGTTELIKATLRT